MDYNGGQADGYTLTYNYFKYNYVRIHSRLGTLQYNYIVYVTMVNKLYSRKLVNLSPCKYVVRQKRWSNESLITT